MTQDDDAGSGGVAAEQPKPASANPLRRWFASRSISQLGQLGVLVVLAVTAAFGGMDTVNQHVTNVEAGAPFEDGPFTVTVERVRLVPKLAAGTRAVMPAQPGRVYLAVVATLVADGTIPVELSHELELVGVRDAKWAGAIRVADGARVFWLGPGLTDELGFVWSVPEGAVNVGDSVTVRIWKKQFTELKVTYGRTWLDSVTDYGQVVVPVTSPS